MNGQGKDGYIEVKYWVDRTTISDEILWSSMSAAKMYKKEVGPLSAVPFTLKVPATDIRVLVCAIR